MNYVTGEHLYVDQPWTHNIGHALWDGLFSAWVGMLENLRGNAPKNFRIVLNAYDISHENYKESLFYEAIQPFGGDGVMAHLNRESLEADKTIADWICFERIHIGAGAKGLRWYNEDFRVAGTEHMRAFRDRMLRMHDVKQSGVRQSGDILRLYSEATISVFDNKRYRWEKTMAQIEHAIRTLKDDGLDIEYVKWENISRRYALSSHLTPWKAQLATVSQTSIYVTEPGTGMMMAPFLSDGAVVVNLLSRVSSQIHVVPDDGSSLRVETPDPMEDNLLASVNYIRVLHFPLQLRLHTEKILEHSIIEGMIHRALNMIGTQSFNSSTENLSYISLVLSRTCKRMAQECKSVLDIMNGLRNCKNEIKHKENNNTFTGFGEGLDWPARILLRMATTSFVGLDDESCIPTSFRNEFFSQSNSYPQVREGLRFSLRGSFDKHHARSPRAEEEVIVDRGKRDITKLP